MNFNSLYETDVTSPVLGAIKDWETVINGIFEIPAYSLQQGVAIDHVVSMLERISVSVAMPLRYSLYQKTYDPFGCGDGEHGLIFPKISLSIGVHGNRSDIWVSSILSYTQMTAYPEKKPLDRTYRAQGVIMDIPYTSNSHRNFQGGLLHDNNALPVISFDLAGTEVEISQRILANKALLKAIRSIANRLDISDEAFVSAFINAFVIKDRVALPGFEHFFGHANI